MANRQYHLKLDAVIAFFCLNKSFVRPVFETFWKLLTLVEKSHDSAETC